YETLRSCDAISNSLVLLCFVGYLTVDAFDIYVEDKVEKVNKLLISNKETHEEWKHWLDITPDEGYNLILEPLL
ncbi:23537_t:CDS:1, partial [Entrophospora sp. SA101]